MTAPRTRPDLLRHLAVAVAVEIGVIVAAAAVAVTILWRVTGHV